jgi:hypothetical protein
MLKKHTKDIERLAADICWAEFPRRPTLPHRWRSPRNTKGQDTRMRKIFETLFLWLIAGVVIGVPLGGLWYLSRVRFCW